MCVVVCDEKDGAVKKKRGGDCSQQLRLRQERLLRKAAKNYQQNTQKKGERKWSRGETSVIGQESLLTALPRLDCEAVAQGQNNILMNESGRNGTQYETPYLCA